MDVSCRTKLKRSISALCVVMVASDASDFGLWLRYVRKAVCVRVRNFVRDNPGAFVGARIWGELFPIQIHVTLPGPTDQFELSVSSN